MPKTSKAVLDSTIRATIFDTLNIANIEGFQKINDRQYGIIIEDAEGTHRYARVGVIVAEVREDMIAEDLMALEIEDYNTKQAKKAADAAKRKEKAERDRAAREAKRKEKEKKEGE